MILYIGEIQHTDDPNVYIACTPAGLEQLLYDHVRDYWPAGIQLPDQPADAIALYFGRYSGEVLLRYSVTTPDEPEELTQLRRDHGR